MSDDKSSNIGDDDEGGEGETQTQYITEALYHLCKSDELSITSLQETINNPLLSTDCNYDKLRVLEATKLRSFPKQLTT